MTDASDTPKGPLDGLIVCDLSRILAGPTATQMLGDLGALILKIENPKTGGDDTRAWGPPYADTTDGVTDLSAYFMAANRSKLSVAADIGTEEGRALVREIAMAADVVIENFKPDGLRKYGLDHETLCTERPDLVYCSISGFGQTGPNRKLAGYDLMAQGFGGIMSLTGPAEGTPHKVGVGIADVMCGMYAAIGILAALRHRDATGEGQHIDLALVDSQMAWLINEGTNYLLSGRDPERRGNAHPNICPYDVYPCADGHVILAVGNDGQFGRFATAMGRPDLAVDPRFLTNPLRLENRVALTEIVTDLFAERSQRDILEQLSAVTVPAGPIHTVAQALGSDQAEARGAVISVPRDDVTSGSVQLLGNPLKFSRTPVAASAPPPRVGEHTDIALDRLRDALARRGKR
ncbi:Succinyl-CoA:(R)-benzylsuccinate CoA-transferase subunit BbsF [Roseivivax jejudonensis]|uniref:Succinyl-CoA:(R)-benzylsuccinate CoA-transferase subunit BbsF n=1 Tax=Roseivivax jejudonensis TaxID=1529041 RepID=A0A1X6Z4U1_9RHOB|nr:CoA transferase [Roseivivax jejudonensis]SLN40516.1 Succinyl-CoA:(R)-benzylsuccinate CoA-transferase subunit BbsF [Roseivivax jejudonensis]